MRLKYSKNFMNIPKPCDFCETLTTGVMISKKGEDLHTCGKCYKKQGKVKRTKVVMQYYPKKQRSAILAPEIKENAQQMPLTNFIGGLQW